MQTRGFPLAAVLSLALAACGSDVPDPSSAASVTSASASPPAASAGGIPAGAVLQPSDVRDAEAAPLDQGLHAHVRPLRPCGDDRYPSDETRTDAVAMRFIVPGAEANSTPSVVTEFVGLHSSGGAAAQFAEISAALQKCPGGLGSGADERRWTVLDSDDDSMLVRIDQRYAYADQTPETVSNFAALSRVGDAIVVVADLGWENMGGSEDLVRSLITKAEERASTIG
ncbi:hypothetical protein ACTI_59530 [Actinoplanes sp. OR16]|uniref:hypothetical protein n=1 Tax=Actinoplanes sp. OR16 TaxID=946334 RepID=UPI000F6FBB42|nr:hypothetical protein [Actinoplanes sp. OR16]BBH69268.1 hypothetical protein ACTI_59530 [Actinoplanes sp. OR16]